MTFESMVDFRLCDRARFRCGVNEENTFGLHFLSGLGIYGGREREDDSDCFIG